MKIGTSSFSQRLSRKNSAVVVGSDSLYKKRRESQPRMVLIKILTEYYLLSLDREWSDRDFNLLAFQTDLDKIWIKRWYKIRVERDLNTYNKIKKNTCPRIVFKTYNVKTK